MSLDLKLEPFWVKHSFLVVDMDPYECVLGMTFFHQANPVLVLDWHERTITVQHKGAAVTLPPIAVEQLPVLDRTRHGRASRNCHVLDIPAKYLCVRKDGSMA
jgi:hypothetical protein